MSTSPGSPSPTSLVIKTFGLGTAGVLVMQRLIESGFLASSCVAMNTEPASLDHSSAAKKIQLETPLLRGLGTGGDPDRGRALAEQQADVIKELSSGVDVIFVVAGLGGGAGTGIAPVVTRVAKESGALVLGFVTMPFECEGNRRLRLAQHGLTELMAVADGVVCLANQRVVKLIDEHTTVLDTFKLTNQLLADCLRGVWKLLTQRGPMEIHFSELAALLREQHCESTFAVAEATGPDRARVVLDKLLSHPVLTGGPPLCESQALLVSLLGGPDLAMADISRVMEEIQRQSEPAQVIVGAAVDEAFQDRLAVTMIAVHKVAPAPVASARSAPASEGLDTQLLARSDTLRPGSRIVPPAPELTLEKMQQLMAQQAAAMPRKAGAKTVSRLRQTQLPLEIISKGRFDNSAPTIHKGEDLDVPTYIRRGISLN